MANFRKIALEQFQTSLTELVSGTLKEVSMDPKSIQNFAAFPSVFIAQGADVQYEYEGVPGNDRRFRGQILIRVYANPDDESLIEDLLDVIQAIDDKIDGAMATFQGLSTPIYLVTPARIIDDPLIDLQRDLSEVTLAVDYETDC